MSSSAKKERKEKKREEKKKLKKRKGKKKKKTCAKQVISLRLVHIRLSVVPIGRLVMTQCRVSNFWWQLGEKITLEYHTKV